jgi:hypothetical protein
MNMVGGETRRLLFQLLLQFAHKGRQACLTLALAARLSEL